MRACAGTVIIAVLTVGCATERSDMLATDHQGLAELRVDATPLLAAGITRVTVEAAGFSQDLALRQGTGTFDGTLILPSGPQSLVARAFAGEALVGQSQPTSVEIQPAVVTRVLIRILDLTVQGPPMYGPIVDALSYPTTTQAGAAAVFAISVVAPAGDPVSYEWTSDCADATFSAPNAATTSWSKAAQGACTINVVVASNGFAVAQGFVIVVFPAGSGSGAADASAVFVTAPAIHLALPDLACFVSPGANASCPTVIASPGTSAYSVSVVNWGSSAPGTLELSDDCGGRFGASVRNPGDVSGFWLPPAAGGLCIITARAVNVDGLVGTLSAAVLTHAGAAPTADPPQLSGRFSTFCTLSDSTSPANCGVIPPGDLLFVFGNVFWGNGHPGSLTITDDCAGPLPEQISIVNAWEASWIVPDLHPGDCLTKVRATNLEGGTTEVAGRYRTSIFF